MATALLLSHHSSNPLEVGSSDARNNAYNKRYRASLAQNDDLSSDDPIEGFTVPDDVQQYHDHLSRILPSHPAAPIMRKATPVKPPIDLDDDMSDDELATPMQKQDHEQVQKRTQAVDDEESHEEGHSDKDEAREYAEDDDDCMSVDSFETDEENTINERSPEERREIEEEIKDLMENVPQLQNDYRIVDRLGTGTFSSVYKAVDLHYHTKWDNTPWHGHHPPSSSAYYQSVHRPPGSKVFVAIKRIYVTSSPERIKNEVSIMIDCLNCRHVSQLITATRHLDQVVLIMPYQRNEDFRVSAYSSLLLSLYPHACTGILPLFVHACYQILYAVFDGSTTGHPRAEDYPPRRQASQLLIRSPNRYWNALRLWSCISELLSYLSQRIDFRNMIFIPMSCPAYDA